MEQGCADMPVAKGGAHAVRPAARQRRHGAPDEKSATGRLFRKLGLAEPMDFVLHFPLRYEDETRVVPVRAVRPGSSVQVEGEILSHEVSYRPRKQLKAVLSDGDAEITLRWLNFYPSQVKQVEPGMRVRALGEVRGGLWGCEMVHPRIRRSDAPLPEALTPVYPTTSGLSQPVLRQAVLHVLAQADLSDPLPESVRERYGLMPFGDAVHQLHAPGPGDTGDGMESQTHPAWLRVKFDELLAQQLSMAEARALRQHQRAWPLIVAQDADTLPARLLSSLPFALTVAQQRVVADICHDMARAHPMHRLLQGDVGSGKTVVAALAAVQAIAAGAQVALMAPTEILAEQHYLKLDSWLAPLGITTVLLNGRLGQKARRLAQAAIESGEAALVIGTQALIQDKVSFNRLGLVIVDEQHRFGVGQRLALGRKGEQAPDEGAMLPHQLMMSATPIPRTLAMTYFSDLDVSVIDELPPGRTPVKTKLIAEHRRGELAEYLADAVRAGRQAYWVCPLVEESEALDLQNAVDTHAGLQVLLPGLRIGLVHGRLPQAEKSAIMEAFRAGEMDILVSTTVIEVGVDVPNASTMVIEHAERFGLAQLHQLRGRVGRGSAASICVLLYQAPLSQVARQRLRAMFETEDGFEIARRDLELRGPGEFLGVRQSGVALLRFADLQADAELAEQARDAASYLRQACPEAARAHLQRWLRGREDYLRT